MVSVCIVQWRHKPVLIFNFASGHLISIAIFPASSPALAFYLERAHAGKAVWKIRDRVENICPLARSLQFLLTRPVHSYACFLGQSAVLVRSLTHLMCLMFWLMTDILRATNSLKQSQTLTCVGGGIHQVYRGAALPPPPLHIGFKWSEIDAFNW